MKINNNSDSGFLDIFFLKLFKIADRLFFFNFDFNSTSFSDFRRHLKDYQIKYLEFKKKYLERFPAVDNSRKLYQFSPSFMKGDGVGNLGVLLDKKHKKAGFKTKMFAKDFNKELHSNIFHISEYKNDLKENDIALLHFTGDSDVNDFTANLKCEKWFYYHNVTPSEFFRNYDREIYKLTLKGRDKLPLYKNKFDKSVTWSAYNYNELEKLGFKNIKLTALPKDFDMLDCEIDREIFSRFDDGYYNIIFTGRILPYKNYKLLIDSYERFKSKYKINARLLLPGAPDDALYKKELDDYILKKNIKNVEFFGRIEQCKLNALYKVSNLFLCVSYHEGYCMPVIEAMYFELPVLALDNGAIKETVAEGGIVLESSADADIIADNIYKIYSDAGLKNNIIKNQRKVLFNKYL